MKEIRAALDGAELLMGEKIRMRDDLSPLTDFIANTTRPILFLNIGSDGMSGDSYGPLLGTMLTEKGAPNFGVVVRGTLESPIHAVNLSKAIAVCKVEFPNHLWVATDSSLGRVENVGSVVLAEGMLTPGTAAKKMLPPVGDYLLSGMVAHDLGDPFKVLPYVSLNLVYNLAKRSAIAIINGLERRAQRVPAESQHTAT